MTLPDFLTLGEQEEIRLTNHRIGLFHVVHYYNEGYSPEMLVGQYPTLPLSLIHKVIAFYLENRDEVDAYIATCQSELDQQRQSHPKRIDVAALRQRLQNLQTEHS